MKKSEIRRAKLKLAAARRAEFNYETAMRRIDHRIDVIEPEVAAIDAAIADEKSPVVEIEASDDAPEA